jgi:uncharacterized integral membrane protein
VYLALERHRYRSGLLALAPCEASPLVEASPDESAIALRRWFGGQLIAMLLVGGRTAAGLWLIGVPAFLGLDLIAGLTEFIPILGPIAGVVPALMVASAQDWVTVAWVLALFVFIQQVENNVILPLLTGRTVQMPAALGIFATLAMGVLFGALGLLFGYPLAIVADVWVRKLYVRELLEKDTTLRSESQEPDLPGHVRQSTRGGGACSVSATASLDKKHAAVDALDLRDRDLVAGREAAGVGHIVGNDLTAVVELNCGGDFTGHAFTRAHGQSPVLEGAGMV